MYISTLYILQLLRLQEIVDFLGVALEHRIKQIEMLFIPF